MEVPHPKRIKVEFGPNDVNLRNQYEQPVPVQLPCVEGWIAKTNQNDNNNETIKVEENCNYDIGSMVETDKICAKKTNNLVDSQVHELDDVRTNEDAQVVSTEKIVKQEECTQILSRSPRKNIGNNEKTLLENDICNLKNVKVKEENKDEEKESSQTFYENLTCGLGSDDRKEEHKDDAANKSDLHVYQYISRHKESIETIAHRCHVKKEVLMELNKNFIPAMKLTKKYLNLNTILLIPCLEIKTKLLRKDEWETAKVIAEKKGKGFLISHQNGETLWKNHLFDRRRIKVVKKEDDSLISSGDEYPSSKASLNNAYLKRNDYKSMMNMDIQTEETDTDNTDANLEICSREKLFQKYWDSSTNDFGKSAEMGTKKSVDFEVIKVEGADVVLTPDFPDLKTGDRISYIWSEDGNRYISRLHRWIKHSDDDFSLILCTDGIYNEVQAKELRNIAKVPWK